MVMIAIFLASATLSFALSLVLADLLGPDAFGRYAVALSVAVVINTVLFEWMRLSTTRFYSRADPSVRATLARAYMITSAALATVTGAALALEPGLSGVLLAAAAVSGLALGLFDYHAALARARFDDRAYAGLVLVRGAVGFALAAAAAWAFASPAVALAAWSAAGLGAILCLRGRLADPAGAGRARRDLALAFARYAVPLVAASAIYQLVPLLNRTILASRSGFAEAGYFVLASEIATRLFQNIGSALDLALFQLAVRADETHGRAAAERQVARNLAIVVGIVCPAAVGLWLAWPSFEAVFVPVAFRGHVADATALVIPALAAFATIQYALNPVFQLRHRTAPVVAAALVALAVDVALLAAWPGLDTPRAVAGAQLAGFAGGLAVLVGTALAAGARLPWRDLGSVTLACAVMAAGLFAWRDWHPGMATLALQVAAGAAIYGAVALALDLAGARELALGRLRHGRRALPDVTAIRASSAGQAEL